jgi:hypothetical protein
LKKAPTWPDCSTKGTAVKKLFEQYRDGNGTLVISFNDGTTITGEFIRENEGFLQITGQVNAIGQMCYVPYPNENIKYMYWKDRDARAQSPLP